MLSAEVDPTFEVTEIADRGLHEARSGSARASRIAPLFADGRGVTDNDRLECDLCIVGAGAAGITLGLELAGSRLSVYILEAGGFEFEPVTQVLYQGESVGYPDFPLDQSRLRMFGGSTGHWYGWCRPLDPVDFEQRGWVPESGWPIRRRQLDPFYARAQKYVQIGPPTYSPAFWEGATRAAAFRLPERLIDTAVYQYSPPTRFGLAYRDALRGARNVSVFLHSNVTSIELTPDGSRVDEVRVATLTGKRFRVRARRFVVAVGGIETPRLLLASTSVHRTGVGNGHDLVGRYFADHPHAPVALATLRPSRWATSLYRRRKDVLGTAIRGVFVTSERLMASERTLRFSATIDPVEMDPYVDRTKDAEKRAERSASDLAALDRALHGAGDRGVFSLFMRTEQAPNRDSRLTLAEEKDELGMQKPRLDWRLSELDRFSVVRSVEALARAFGVMGLGHVYSRPIAESDFWERVFGGWHHMGTARMHADPRRGVVDGDCRVHGVSNLYLAGSSVFTTTGFANPTLTIVALAIRLAGRLRAGRA